MSQHDSEYIFLAVVTTVLLVLCQEVFQIFWFHCPNFSQDLFLTRCYQNIKTTNDFPIADAACLGGACVITGRGVPLGVTGPNITGHQSRRRRRVMFLK